MHFLFRQTFFEPCLDLSLLSYELVARKFTQELPSRHYQGQSIENRLQVISGLFRGGWAILPVAHSCIRVTAQTHCSHCNGSYERTYLVQSFPLSGQRLHYLRTGNYTKRGFFHCVIPAGYRNRITAISGSIAEC